MPKLRLFTPGPAMVPEDVLLAMAHPIDHHRTAGFRELFKDVTEHLNYLFQTEAACLTITGSGTCAAEGAIVSCLPPGHKALVCDAGKFGQRWGKICDAFNIANVKYELDWGHGFKPDGVANKLDENPDIDTVIVTHSETSTPAVPRRGGRRDRSFPTRRPPGGNRRSPWPVARSPACPGAS